MTIRLSLALLMGTASLALSPAARADDGTATSATLEGGATMMVAQAAGALAPGRYVWQDDAALGPATIVISIPDQKAYVYRGTTLVAASTVSTGKEGNDTPIGAFTILQKREVHHSNLYDSAPMPYMQRLTWDGVAIHAGRNPGYPASHGCIRVPTAFAKKLFAATSMGGAVLVTDQPVTEQDDPGSILATLPPTDAELTALANAQVAGR